MKKDVASPKHIKELKPDPRNARKHNPRNIGQIVDSLQKVGAARSIVVDEDNVILAGNGMVEAAAEAGITKLQIVEADGDTVIAVRRKGLSKQQKQALALYDNRTAELAEWDADVLKQLIAEQPDLSKLWGEDELERLLDEFHAGVVDAPALSASDRPHFQQMTFTLHDDQVQTVKDALAKAQEAGCDMAQNENSNGNALAFVCEQFLG